MNSEVIVATPTMWVFVGVSVAVFVGGMAWLLAKRKERGKFSWAGFVFVMFVAVLLYVIGLWGATEQLDPPLLAAFHALQIMSANKDFEVPVLTGADAGGQWFLTVYGVLLFITAPVSVVIAAVEFFSEVFSGVFAWGRSLATDSYVFSCLNERTIDLAWDVHDKHRTSCFGVSLRPCIIFARCGASDGEQLAEARKMGAFCLEGDVEAALHKCSCRTVCSVILLDENEEDAIAMVRRLKRVARGRRSGFGPGKTRVFALTDFRNTEALLFPEVLKEGLQAGEGTADEGRVAVRSIDLARELVEQVITRYPVFLLSKPPAADDGAVGATGAAGTCWFDADADQIASRRRDELYSRDDRHILVVGAGSTGTGFLSAALWASRIDGMHTRIDVVDGDEDPSHTGRSLAEARFEAEAPEIMRLLADQSEENGEGEPSSRPFTEGTYDLHFILANVETDAYAKILARRATTLSYVFIALGDDLLNARVAMRTRQVLECELAKRSKSREEYLCASRPLIIAVVRNDDFAAAVTKAKNDGQPYDIVCVGSDRELLTYKMLSDLMEDKRTEYKRRSSRASSIVIKYRLFAFARSLYKDRHGAREAFETGMDQSLLGALCETFGIEQDNETLGMVREAFTRGLDGQTILSILDEVDWTVEVKRDKEVAEVVKTWRLALLYQLYCSDGITRALDSMEPDNGYSREWLLRMEHERWNAYVRTQGFEVADLATTRRVFATGQADTEKHRSNLAGLHPCLTSFDDLADLDQPIYSWYKDYFEQLDEREAGLESNLKERRNSKAKDGAWLQLADDKYIRF